MAEFVQIIEFRTSQIGEIRDLVTDLRTRTDSGGLLRATLTADRDRPGWYFNIVEFESREAAMANSERREVGEFAGRMSALCEGPPKYYNLEVVHTWSGPRAQRAMSMLVGTATAAAGVAAAGVGKARHQLGDVRGRVTEMAHVGRGAPPAAPPGGQPTTATGNPGAEGETPAG
jgi:hypothetical protein